MAILTDWPEIDVLARNPTLDSVIHQHVGEPIDSTLSAAGMYAGKFLYYNGQLWVAIYLRNITMLS